MSRAAWAMAIVAAANTRAFAAGAKALHEAA
jgi:hypothetical protein